MQKKSYSEKDLAYFNRFTSGYSPYAEKDLDTILEPIDSLIGHLKRFRVCEIGCASGQFSQALAARYINESISLFGLDIASHVLSLYPYEKICGSAFSMPFKSESFNMICLPATLHHLFPLADSVKELYRILAPGGYFYCMEPNYFHPQRYFFMRFKILYNLYRKTNDVPIDPEKLKNMLRTFDLEPVFFKYINIYSSQPSFLQRIQNTVSYLQSIKRLRKYLLPWFILIARKKSP